MSHKKKSTFKNLLKKRKGDPVSILLKNGQRVNGVLEKIKCDYVQLSDMRDPKAVMLECICGIEWAVCPPCPPPCPSPRR